MEQRPPVGLELLFTVCEENALRGAKAFDARALRSEFGYVFDHASPIGEVIVASPTYYRLEADFHGAAAHAGIRPEEGRSAIAAAAAAVAAMRLGRVDEETTANVGRIEGGSASTNVVPERCRIEAEARSLDDAAASRRSSPRWSTTSTTAPTPTSATSTSRWSGCSTATGPGARRPRWSRPRRRCARCGYEPSRVVTGGGSDANALEAAGFSCVNLANGTQRNHEPGERVTVAALEGMLDVSLALVDRGPRGGSDGLMLTLRRGYGGRGGRAGGRVAADGSSRSTGERRAGAGGRGMVGPSRVGDEVVVNVAAVELGPGLGRASTSST